VFKEGYLETTVKNYEETIMDKKKKTKGIKKKPNKVELTEANGTVSLLGRRMSYKTKEKKKKKKKGAD